MLGFGAQMINEFSGKSLSNVRDVIFDFGGILFEIDYNAPVREFAKLGFTDFVDIYSQASQSDIFDQLETGKISNEDFFHFIESKCPNASPEEVRVAWDSILTKLWPENVDYVKKLRRSGFKTFLLSNTNAIHVASFEKMIDTSMGLNSFRESFDQVYYSNVIGMKKPYPSTFLKVCEWNGLKPQETLFIDDSIQHVKGASEAGLLTVHMTDMKQMEGVIQSILHSQG
jgi:epoxide hydrolase-like predicted phosphatase